jgi:hypothetical protein
MNGCIRYAEQRYYRLVGRSVTDGQGRSQGINISIRIAPAALIKEDMKETYHYMTGQRINKRQWNDLVKRYGLTGDSVIQGRTTIAYKRIRPMTEAETVKMEGRF